MEKRISREIGFKKRQLFSKVVSGNLTEENMWKYFNIKDR